MGPSGLEPPTLRLSVVRSSQLSYGPVSSARTSYPSLPLPAKARSLRRASSSNRTRFAGLRFEFGVLSSIVSPEVRRHKRFDAVKTLTQGGIHFRRASSIDSRAPAKAQLLWDGGDSRDRTGDLLLARQALSQLSYIPSYLVGPVPSKLNNVTSKLRPADQDVTNKLAAYWRSP